MRRIDEIQELKRRIAWAERGSKEEFLLKEKLRELEAQERFENQPKENTNQISLF